MVYRLEGSTVFCTGQHYAVQYSMQVRPGVYDETLCNIIVITGIIIIPAKQSSNISVQSVIFIVQDDKTIITVQGCTAIGDPASTDCGNRLRYWPSW